MFLYYTWNARVGNQEIPRITGKVGLGIQNEARQRLREFCQKNMLVIADTFFQQPKIQLYTQTSPDVHYQNYEIDYTLHS